VAFLSRRTSRDAALVELQRLHAAILASKARRGALPATPGLAAGGGAATENAAERELTRRLQADAVADVDIPAETAKSKKVWWLLAAAAVVVAGAWMTATVLRRPNLVADSGSAPGAPAPRPAAVPDAAPVVAKPPAAPVVPTRAVRVGLTTIRPVWMRVMVDGRRAIEREVAAGETLAFEADTRVLVRVGDAGGVSATVNGAARGPLGRDGFPVTVAFPTPPAAPASTTEPASTPPRAATAPPAADATSRPPE
jgi:hypothetical protein